MLYTVHSECVNNKKEYYISKNNKSIVYQEFGLQIKFLKKMSQNEVF